MSPNAPTSKLVPDDSDLLAFAKTNEAMSAKLAAVNMTAEQAVQSKAVRPKLVEAYMKIVSEQEAVRRSEEAARRAEEEAEEAARVAQAEQALIDGIDNDILGVTPEQKRQKSIADWVLAFGKGETADLPVPVTDNDGSVHFCALPVPCCDKKQPVKAGAILNGEVYGLCASAVVAYKAATPQLGRVDRLYYMNLREAKRVLQEMNEISAITSWIYSFAWDKTQDLPVKRLDSQKNWLCGLPDNVPCCDHAQVAVRYGVYNGKIYGLCQRAANLFWQCYSECSIKKLQSADSPQKLEHVVVAQNKDAALSNWVDAFVVGTDYEPPTVFMAEDGQNLLCGMPESVGCCDHTEIVDAFPSIDGIVYGICKKAAWAFRDGRDRHNHPDCLKYTKDYSQAEYFAEQWRLRNIAPASSDPNKPSANTKAKQRARLKVKQARAEADNAVRPKPNQGSGDIAEQSMGKGGGGKGKSSKSGGKKK